MKLEVNLSVRKNMLVNTAILRQSKYSTSADTSICPRVAFEYGIEGKTFSLLYKKTCKWRVLRDNMQKKSSHPTAKY